MITNLRMELFQALDGNTNTMMLEVGADPDTVDVTGYSALEWARYNQDAHIVNLLLQYNATQ